MGNAFDKVINKGPPFAPKCVPECTPGPNDLRGNICYKGKCVALCPVDSIIGEDGKCLCNEDNAVYKDDNSKMNNNPSDGDGWGYCIEEGEETIVEDEDEDEEFAKEIEKNPDMSEEEKLVLKKDIKKKVEKKKKEKEKKKKKQKLRFNPTSLFIDRTPKELDERVKVIVKAKLKENPNMTDEELAELISQTTVDVVEELAVECEEEYKLVKTILSPKYGNGKWPTKEDLEVLIDTKNFPWLKSQVNQWPEEKSITSCQIISAIKDKITLNNRCIYSDDYPNMVEECNVDCGLGTEVREKKIIRQSNDDFPSLQPCSGDIPKKEFECDSGLICKEDCKLEINMKSFGEARCSKPCDSGDGPGEKTYKIKYIKASQGDPDDMGSCELDEEGKEEGQEYDVTVECNKEKCPDCEVKSKGPFKDNLVDYTGSININNVNKTFTKCLLPKEDGGFEDIDCGGAEGGHNYTKGARAKYNMTYKITKDDYGVQNCTKGEDIIEEGCSVNAFDPDLNPIIGTDGKIIKGGGEECGNECILSDDFPQLVMVEAKACSKDCGGGLQRMRKVVKSKSDAPYCPCKDDPSKCPYEEIPCNTQACIAPCVYGNEGNHVQINDMCPGVKGPNKDIVWDTTKTNAAGGKGMWFDSIGNKYYERSHFVKKMRVPTLKPPIGKGLCYQGDKADKTLQCSIEGAEKPVDAEWGPWKFDNYTGLGTTIKTISDKHSEWTFPKINVVKVGATPVGLTVPGSSTVKWPSSGGIDKVVEEIKKMGHTLGKTVHYVQKANGKIWLYKKGNANGTSGADTWEFQKGAEQNPNFGKKGEHCISEEGLGMAIPEELPGIRYTRDVKVFPEYGGKSATEIDGGNNIRVDPYMKKDGIITKKEGTPAKNMSEAECKAYAKSVGLTYWVADGGHQDNNPSGCQIWSDGNIKFNKKQNNLPCTSTSKNWQKGCIEKGPGGAGYTKYCPVDALLNPEIPIDDIDITKDLGDESRCYTQNKTGGKKAKKYTVKELEDEAKRRFVRDNQLPTYIDPARNEEYRILGPGSRQIYRSKVRDEATPAKYGGLTTGLWHEKKENFGDVYDRRIREYDNCDGVDEVIRKIRDNDPSWKSSSLVKQVDCVPIYEWDGKFYKDKASAQGIIEKKSGTPLKNMTEEECEAYAKSINKWGGSGKFNDTVPGCYRYKNPSNPTHDMDIFFNKDDNNTLCSNRDNCVEKIKYGTNDEEIITHTDTGRKELSTGEKEKNPGSNMRKTNNGKFMTTHMHPSCLNPGLDSNRGLCSGLSTHDYIQMITGSGNIELIKGVVTQGRKDYDQWVTKFEVYVSRNGDSWKQMKNSSNQTEFTGNTNRSTKVKNYFNEVVEAKYIRFVTKAWHGYNSIRIGYIRDKSGAVKCKGESGLLQSEPWFRFTFNEAKTKSPPKEGDAQYSQGTAASTKQCPPSGHVLVAQRGEITSGPNNIRVNDLKLLRNNKVYGLKGEMSNELLTGCGVDANSPGWYSSSSGGSKKTWSGCVKPNNKGLKTGTAAYHTDDGGYRYMYRHWNDGDGKGYNKLPESSPYKDNTHSSNANNGVKYNLPSTNINIVDYENTNIIRQACNRGPKMVLPTLSKEWVSTIPAATGGTSGWKGNIWNYSGGTEGWLDQAEKIKWTDGFKLKVYDLIKNKGIGSRKDVNDYLVEEKEGTNDNKDGDHHSWCNGSKREGGHIGGNKAYHSIGYSESNWRTGFTDSNSCAKYRQSTEFWPVGIKVQPRSGYKDTQAPTELKLVWNGGKTTVTLGTFAKNDTVKTILIDPGLRKKTTYLYVYSRHGRASTAVSFRINFLIGKIGGGYSQDKGHSINNNNSRPVDCQDGKEGLSNLVETGNSSTSTSWLNWSACSRSCNTGSQSAQGTTTVTQPRKYKKIDPKHGGRDNCKDTSGPNKVDTKSESRRRNCNTHACCSYSWIGYNNSSWSAAWLGSGIGGGIEVNSWSGGDWGKQHKRCYNECRTTKGCARFQISGGYCYRYKAGKKWRGGRDVWKLNGRGLASGQCKNN